LQFINAHAPYLPIFTLTDYDVDGLNIARCYRFSADQTSRSQPTVNLGVRDLGINTAQLLRLSPPLTSPTRPSSTEALPPAIQSAESTTQESISSAESRGPVDHLTFRDRKVAVGILLALAEYETDHVAMEMVIELQRMLMIGTKCEIQWLDDSGNLAAWLNDELLGVL
jgi:hypothetical protein